jgi:hypothetical protein
VYFLFFNPFLKHFLRMDPGILFVPRLVASLVVHVDEGSGPVPRWECGEHKGGRVRSTLL